MKRMFQLFFRKTPRLPPPVLIQPPDPPRPENWKPGGVPPRPLRRPRQAATASITPPECGKKLIAGHRRPIRHEP